MKPSSADPRGGLVWDLGVRAFHWLLVLLIAAGWWTYRSDAMLWHRRNGYAIAALLAFRLFWGFVGSAPARFDNFVRSPAEVVGYIRGQIRAGVGHNPAGGWSVLALLAALAVLVVTGLLGVTQEGDSGRIASLIPFAWSRAATHLHALAFNALLALIGLHLAAVLIHQLLGHDLIRPMLSGRKHIEPDLEGQIPPERSSGWIGLGLALVVYLGLIFVDRV
jgi:cytochrome b